MYSSFATAVEERDGKENEVPSVSLPEVAGAALEASTPDTPE